MHDSVTVPMAAPPEKVWALVSDVTRIGEFSPETFEAEWLDGSTEAVVGARFRGHVNRNNKGVKYWTTCRVVACEPERELAFDVEVGGRPVSTWRYVLVPRDGGTDVTESFELATNLGTRLYWAIAGRARGRTNRRNMTATIERMGAVLAKEGAR